MAVRRLTDRQIDMAAHDIVKGTSDFLHPDSVWHMRERLFALGVLQREPVETKTIDIYALHDPDTMEIRYVGRSTDPETRRIAHLTIDHRKVFRSCKERWIVELWRAGKEPVMTILETVPYSRKREAEQEWIDRCLAQGCNLTNSAMP